MRRLFTALLCTLILNLGFAQEFTVSGTVTDSETNEPLGGVLVKLSVGDGSTYTDLEGAFKLSVSDGYENLILSLDGYNSETIFINGQSQLKISLAKSASSSKAQTTASQLNADDLGTQPVVELEQATQGRAAGVFVQNSGGRLGQGTKVRIRGGSSLSGSNDPLYVVDGVPLTSDNQSDIDPSTIESMEILKDASATALYGSRAANGVVLITTKKGKSGKLKADIEYQFGVNQLMKKLDMMDKQDYEIMQFEYTMRSILNGLPSSAISGVSSLENSMTYDNMKLWYSEILAERAEAIENGNQNFSYTFPVGNAQISSMSKDNPIFRYEYDTDWQDQAFRTGISNRANVNLSGGSNKQKLYANFNYLSQEGILINNKYDRLGGRLNWNSNWSDKLRTNVSVGFAKTDNNRVNEDADDGNPVQTVLLPPGDESDPDNFYILRVRSSEYNPETEVYNSLNFETSTRMNGSAALDYNFAENLVFHLDGGLDYMDVRDERVQGPPTQVGAPDGYSRLGTSEVFNYLVNGTLNYSLEMGDNTLNALVGASYQNSNSIFTYREYRVNSINDLESVNEDLLPNGPITGSAFAFASTFASIGYNISDKYDVEVTARMDGSSRFGQNNRVGVFPAASFGWTLSNESFLKGISAISFLKLNASYGVVGNTPYDDFLYRMNYYWVKYGTDLGYRFGNLQNEDLRWESTNQMDLSLDFGILDNRVSGSVSYYQKTTTDLILPKPISMTSGFRTGVDNIGEMTNSGFEFAVNTVNVEKGDFSWRTSFNISSFNIEVTDLGGQRFISGPSAFLEGEAPGVFYLSEYLGVNSATGEAQYSNTLGLPTSDYNTAQAARAPLGNPNPKLFGGMSNSLSFKGFDLNFMFQFVQGVDAYWETGEIIANSGYNQYNQVVDQNERWFVPGDEAPYPVMNTAATSTNPSSRWLVDASYIRLKSLTLSYSLPTALVQKMKLSNFSIYVGGQNLFTFSDYPGYDPDVSSTADGASAFAANINRGIDYFTAPQPKVYTTGIKIGF